MATFKALNIEDSGESDDELEDTREIQIEEALKLYQNALRLHAQGPSAYPDAEQAYQALFQSEIFKYHAADDDILGYGLDGDITTPLAPAPQARIGSDGLPSTLPQILYLSYKNYGQFVLDTLKFQLEHTKRNTVKDGLAQENSQIKPTSAKAIEAFSDALERDETDSALWRRAARLGEVLGSFRIARFCLESCLDEVEENADALGLEGAFATQHMRQVLQHGHAKS